jgi:hypothetical protein
MGSWPGAARRPWTSASMGSFGLDGPEASRRHGASDRMSESYRRRSGSVDRSQAAAPDRPTCSVLALEFLVDSQDVQLMGEVVAALTRPEGHTHGVRDRFTTFERMKVIASAAAIDEVDVVVGVADAKPTEGRRSPPLLVLEADFVGESRFTRLARGDQAGDDLANPLVRAQVPKVNPPETIGPAEEVIATLVERVRRLWPHALTVSTSCSCMSSCATSASGSTVMVDGVSRSGSRRPMTARTGILYVRSESLTAYRRPDAM